MATPYKNAAGLTPEDVYDIDVKGDGPEAAINGIGYRRADGVLLRFAALKYGSAAAQHGYRIADGRDFSALWAAKGTARYALPIDGQVYQATETGSAGNARLTFIMANDGTYRVTRTLRGVETVLDSGSWLPPNKAIAQCSCSFTATPTNVTLSGDGTFNNANSAASAQPLTTTQSVRAESATYYSGDLARQSLVVVLRIYVSGVLDTTTTITLATTAQRA